MDLITLRDIDLGFGGDPLLEKLSLRVVGGERVCLLGRNGSGKTSLLRVLMGDLQADGGEIIRQPTIRIAGLPQSVPPGISGSTHSVVSAGLGELGALIEEHLRLSNSAGEGRNLEALEAVHQRIDAAGAWDVEQRIERTLTHLALDGQAPFEELSGGLQRRVLLARALVSEPQLLLLDEPTNHLDVEAIEWLEGLIASWRGGVLFTTHDRRLLERVATRIVELENGRATSWPGNYANYLRRREERQAAESKERERFEKKLAKEEAWIRQGIKARRTRNEGRVRKLMEMRDARARRRKSVGRATFTTQSAQASGKRVFEARAVSFGFDDQLLIEGLDTFIARGDRIGIIGPNGSGKTSLLRLLVGELQPGSGEILTGAGVRIAYFDQHRARLDETASVADNVSDGAEHVAVDGGSRHVISYLQDFLFTPERARSPVNVLSGGERARLLLARLFAKPSNVLVMDEPTNDLDVETLELLEERLTDYPGSLLLVSHDRAFLDNVVTSTLVLEGQGRVGEYVGGYSDWLRQRATPAEPEESANRPARDKREKPSKATPRLSYKQKRELESLPERIESLEAELAALQAELADPALYKKGESAIAVPRESLSRVQSELAAGYERWSELEALAPKD
ncbi:MAG: ATP-binding cassette domain-containing protein [Gammaproteobacteria bacterium]|nr:ATP-binding cassette domain-containing protein [Gammaproteobacteria bacterium]